MPENMVIHSLEKWAWPGWGNFSVALPGKVGKEKEDRRAKRKSKREKRKTE